MEHTITGRRMIAMLAAIACGAAMATVPATAFADETGATHTVDPATGKVAGVVDDPSDGPDITKIRVLKEGDFLEIYWNEYVDENQAVNPDNFVLRNGDAVIALKPKPAQGVTDTLYFDKDNKEIGATSGNSMQYLDPSLHFSSIAYTGTIDPSQPITLEVKGDAIKDNAGKPAADSTYTGVPQLSFYSRQLTSKTGIVIKSDDTVPESTLRKAAELVDIELGKAGTGIPEAMVEANNSFAVYSAHENAYFIPEQRNNFDKNLYDIEGAGGVPTRDGWISSIAEKSILRTTGNPDPAQNTGYPNESILIHEFAHSIFIGGINQMKDPTLRDTYYKAFAHSRAEGLWNHTYAFQDSNECFATMAAIWFNVMSEGWNGTYDGVRGPINTRAELKEYDPVMYDALSKIFPDETMPAPWDVPAPNDYGIEYAQADKPKDESTTSEDNDLTNDVFQITADRFHENGDYYYIHPGFTARGGGLDLYSLWGSYNGADDTSSGWKITRTDDGVYSFAVAPGGGWSDLGLTENEDSTVTIANHPADATDPAQQWRFVHDATADNPYDGYLVNVKYGNALSTPTQPYGYSLLAAKDPSDPSTMTWRLRNATKSRAAATDDSAPDLYMLPDQTADKTALVKAIDQASKLKESDYTAESWNSFAKALADAQSVNDDIAATQGQIDTAVKALADAQGKLVKTEPKPEPQPEPTPTPKPQPTPSDQKTPSGKQPSDKTPTNPKAGKLSDTGASVTPIAAAVTVLAAMAAGLGLAVVRRRR